MQMPGAQLPRLLSSGQAGITLPVCDKIISAGPQLRPECKLFHPAVQFCRRKPAEEPPPEASSSASLANIEGPYLIQLNPSRLVVCSPHSQAVS